MKQSRYKQNTNLLHPAAVEGVERIVADFYNLSTEQIKQFTRKGEIKEARQICMWWRFTQTKATLEEIGGIFSNKSRPAGMDHATVLHATKTIKNYRETDKKFKAHTDEISTKIEAHIAYGGHYEIARNTLARLRQQMEKTVRLVKLADVADKELDPDVLLFNIQSKQLLKNLEEINECANRLAAKYVTVSNPQTRDN